MTQRAGHAFPPRSSWLCARNDREPSFRISVRSFAVFVFSPARAEVAAVTGKVWPAPAQADLEIKGGCEEGDDEHRGAECFQRRPAGEGTSETQPEQKGEAHDGQGAARQGIEEDVDEVALFFLVTVLPLGHCKTPVKASGGTRSSAIASMLNCRLAVAPHPYMQHRHHFFGSPANALVDLPLIRAMALLGPCSGVLKGGVGSMRVDFVSGKRRAGRGQFAESATKRKRVATSLDMGAAKRYRATVLPF